MRLIGIGLVLLAGLAVVTTGCGPAKTAPEQSAQQETTAKKTAVETAVPVGLDELEALGVKVVKNDDGTLKTLDFSPCDLSKFTGGLDEKIDLSAVRVIRGKGNCPDALAESFARCAKLSEFLWTEAEFSDAALTKLAALSGVKKLRLSGLKMSSNSVAILTSFPAVADLDISGSTVTDIDLEQIAAMPNLAKINLYQTAVTDAGVSNLLPMKDRLISLNLDATKVTNAGMKTISALENLTFLHLGRTTIDDAAAEPLAKLSKLEKIHITRTGMTEAGAAALAEKLPNTEVVSVVEEKE